MTGELTTITSLSVRCRICHRPIQVHGAVSDIDPRTYTGLCCRRVKALSPSDMAAAIENAERLSGKNA